MLLLTSTDRSWDRPLIESVAMPHILSGEIAKSVQFFHQSSSVFAEVGESGRVLVRALDGLSTPMLTANAPALPRIVRPLIVKPPSALAESSKQA
jgi:hypothetical protein